MCGSWCSVWFVCWQLRKSVKLIVHLWEKCAVVVMPQTTWPLCNREWIAYKQLSEPKHFSQKHVCFARPSQVNNSLPLTMRSHSWWIIDYINVIHLPIYLRIASLAIGHGCLSASKVTLTDMGVYISWVVLYLLFIYPNSSALFDWPCVNRMITPRNSTLNLKDIGKMDCYKSTTNRNNVWICNVLYSYYYDECSMMYAFSLFLFRSAFTHQDRSGS